MSRIPCSPNGVVKPVHPNRMPVMLAGEEQFDTWLEGSPEEAFQLVRPYPASEMHVVRTGEKEDAG